MAWPLLLLTAATTAVSAYGKYKSGMSQAKWSEYNAAVARNQQIAVRQSAEFTMKRQARSKERFLSRQVARYAKSGVALEGSPMSVIADSATEFDLDILSEKYNADLEIANLESESNIHTGKAAQIRFATKIDTVSTLLKGASSMASMATSKGGDAASAASGGGGKATLGAGK